MARSRTRRRSAPNYGGRMVSRLLLLSAIYFGWVHVHGRFLKTEAAPWGIISLQAAYDTETAGNIIESWRKKQVIRRAIQNLMWDYGFVGFYSSALAMAYVWAAKRTPESQSKRRAFLLAGAWAQWIAGIFDALENTVHWFMLKGTLPIEAPWPQVAVSFVVFKFLLILIAWPLLLTTLFQIIHRGISNFSLPPIK